MHRVLAVVLSQPITCALLKLASPTRQINPMTDNAPEYRGLPRLLSRLPCISRGISQNSYRVLIAFLRGNSAKPEPPRESAGEGYLCRVFKTHRLPLVKNHASISAAIITAIYYLH